MNFKFRTLFVLFIVLADMLQGCSKKTDSDDSNNPDLSATYQVKQGVVAYRSVKDGETEYITMTFDDYGRFQRIEYPGKSEVMIVDIKAHKQYVIDTEKSEYLEMPYYVDFVSFFLYQYDDLYLQFGAMSGFSKQANKNIAGKDCSMYSGKDDDEPFIVGGWKRILFYLRLESAIGDVFEATSFTDKIPDNSFVVPAGYKRSE